MRTVGTRREGGRGKGDEGPLGKLPERPFVPLPASPFPRLEARTQRPGPEALALGAVARDRVVPADDREAEQVQPEAEAVARERVALQVGAGEVVRARQAHFLARAPRQAGV